MLSLLYLTRILLLVKVIILGVFSAVIHFQKTNNDEQRYLMLLYKVLFYNKTQGISAIYERWRFEYYQIKLF